MPRFHVERILEKIEYELKSGLKTALSTVAPGNDIDLQQLFKEFKKQVVRNCKQWEQVESNAVDTD